MQVRVMLLDVAGDLPIVWPPAAASVPDPKGRGERAKCKDRENGRREPPRDAAGQVEEKTDQGSNGPAGGQIAR